MQIEYGLPSLTFFDFFFQSSVRMGLLVAVLYLVVIVTTCQARYRDRNSIGGYYLEGHVITSYVAELTDCVHACDKNLLCRSINYKYFHKTCEINNENRFSYPDDYKNKGQGYVYGDSLRAYSSCAEIKLAVPQSKSGYYEVFFKKKQVEVYCDMEKYGGGWTLVVGISSTNSEHHQREENNCDTPKLCVPFVTTSVPSRKMADGDIHLLASSEGIFRVDDLDNPLGVNTVFYKIPSGASNFNSGCVGGSECPRIILSHSYPYIWESNCKGIEVGYQIYHGSSHAVFDSHDSSECGYSWWSSQYSSRRILYWWYGSNGIYPNRQGLLFVK